MLRCLLESLSRRGRQFWRIAPMPLWVLIGAFTLILVLASHFSLAVIHLLTTPKKSFPSLRPILVFPGIGVLIGWCSGFLTFLFSKKRWTERLMEVVPRGPAKFLALLGAMVFAILVTSLTALNGTFEWGYFTRVLESHGSFFDWIMGTVTLVGLWVAYYSILEQRRVITSFADLHARLIDLIQDTAKRPDSGNLQFMAYTASIGYLAMRNKYWEKLKQAFITLGPRRLEVICLHDDDLFLWHSTYLGRRTDRKKNGPLGLGDVELATEASNWVTSYEEADDEGKMHRVSVFKKRLETMPGFYVMMNDDRAIIVAPFFVPVNLGATSATDKKHGVEMFGFETTDRRIVEQAHQFFSLHRDSGNSGILTSGAGTGEFSELLDAVQKSCGTWAKPLDAHTARGRLCRFRGMIEQIDDPSNYIPSYLSWRVEGKPQQQSDQDWIGKVRVSLQKDTFVVHLPTQTDRENWEKMELGQHMDLIARRLQMNWIVSAMGKAAGQ
jgi:hypothetical protein